MRGYYIPPLDYTVWSEKGVFFPSIFLVSFSFQTVTKSAHRSYSCPATHFFFFPLSLAHRCGKFPKLKEKWLDKAKDAGQRCGQTVLGGAGHVDLFEVLPPHALGEMRIKLL